MERRYREDSLVLETTFRTTGGTVTVIDCMPVRPESGNQTGIVRVIRGETGSVSMLMDLAIRFDYGKTVPWVKHRRGGLTALSGPSALELRTPVQVRGENFHTLAEFTVSAGQSVPFLLEHHSSTERLERERDPLTLVEETTRWWQDWSKACAYQGAWRDAVLRSLITLKALNHRPTGGIVAAPTTSLPELIGGQRNWDYRYCWLRDATFTLYALLVSGLTDEARAWREWLLRAAAGKPSQLQTVYGVAGERLLPEVRLDWLAGYEDSRPVRIGNLAHRQLQLDVYGEILDVFHVSRRSGLQETEDAWAFQRALLDFLEGDWRKLDNGIWELRGRKRHLTHSRVMAWVALDRGVKAIEQFGLPGPLEKWKRLRQTIHDEVCRQGFDPDKNSFVRDYGSSELDASLLLIPLVGFLPATDPRVLGTVQAVEKELGHNGFLRRYSPDRSFDGLEGSEGAFLPCTFWLADNYALVGRLQDASDLFERLLSIRNDVGLLAEEYDPVAKRQLGNFPQAFTHVSLVNTAHNLTTVGPAAHRSQV